MAPPVTVSSEAPVGVPSVLHSSLRPLASLPLKITSLRSWSRPGEVLLKIPPPKPVPLVISVVPDGVPSVLQSWFRSADRCQRTGWGSAA